MKILKFQLILNYEVVYKSVEIDISFNFPLSNYKCISLYLYLNQMDSFQYFLFSNNLQILKMIYWTF